MEFWHFGVPSISGVETLAQKCEQLGFDGLTLTDSQNLSNETYITLALAARATSTLMIGPGVTKSPDASRCVNCISYRNTSRGFGRSCNSRYRARRLLAL